MNKCREPVRKGNSSASDPLMINGLVGLYFHTYKENTQGERRIHWQGLVVGQISDDMYAVQLFEWIVGSPTDIVLVPVDEMRTWTFYRTADDMNDTYSRRKP